LIEITLYSKAACQQCLRTRDKLDKMGLEYTYADVERDPSARAVVEHLGYLQLPVVLVGDMHWSGFRPDKLNNLGRILNSREWAQQQAGWEYSELDAIEYLRKEMGWPRT